MNKSKLIKSGIFISVLLILIIVSIFIVVKYQVEGEKDIPFQIDKILITSTVDGDAIEDSENLWNINISQPNDVYIYISEVEKTEETIDNIIIDNFKANTAPKKRGFKNIKTNRRF